MYTVGTVRAVGRAQGAAGANRATIRPIGIARTPHPANREERCRQQRGYRTARPQTTPVSVARSSVQLCSHLDRTAIAIALP